MSKLMVMRRTDVDGKILNGGSSGRLNLDRVKWEKLGISVSSQNRNRVYQEPDIMTWEY